MVPTKPPKPHRWRRRLPIALCAFVASSAAMFMAVPVAMMPGRASSMHSTRDGVPFADIARLITAAGDADAHIRQGDHRMIAADDDRPEDDAAYAQAVPSFLDRIGRDVR